MSTPLTKIQLTDLYIGFGEIVIEDWLEAQYTCDKIPDCVLTRTMAKLMYLYELMEQQR